MSATYDETLPTDKDKARSLLGDTEVSVPADALHSDEHITAVLALLTPFEAAVAWLADELVARFSQDPVKITLTGLAVDFSARIPTWEKLAARMRAQAAADAAAAAEQQAAAGSDSLDTYGVW